MTGNEVRKSFIDFFKSKEHKHFESASLIPDDKTLLLTVAGMVPFKPFFLGEKEAPFKRITTYQKCIRTNDLENVGRTPRHQTFFEMLGNFSFGDYFKEESIAWSWEYITEVLKLEKEKLYISVFETDDEAYKIWNEVIGIPKERLVRLGEADNWWAAGPVGSCGPCSEIYYDTGNSFGCPNPDTCMPGCDCDRFLEIWNLVFTEWNRMEDGTLVPLPEKNIDTGAGLERITSVVQNQKTNFDTDLFMPIMENILEVLNIQREKHDVTVKIIADHIRAATFLIGDGVLPSNEGRGYILRKLIRRAFGVGSRTQEKIFGKDDIFLHKFVGTVIKTMEEGYPELESKKEYIEKVVRLEEERFAITLKNGIEILLDEIEDMKTKGNKKLSSEISFKLYDTYGFPLELTQQVIENEGFEVSEEEFNVELEKQVKRSQASKETISDMVKDEFIDEFFAKNGKTEFIGYDELNCSAKVLHLTKIDGLDGYEIIFDKTPFYAESGGQVADKGTIEFGEFEGEITNVVKKKDVFIHQLLNIRGSLPNVGDVLELTVDREYRNDVQRNHTATHILHKALREVLGTHVEQSGSMVDNERLRFDFSHYESITPDQLKEIEKIANRVIIENTALTINYEDIETAKDRGAMALFSDKYGDTVRVVEIPGFSIELCGGTHVKSTGEIGFLNIESEVGIASGVRRITAITGNTALLYVEELEETVQEMAEILKTDTNNILEILKKHIDDVKDLEKANSKLQTRLIKYEIDEMLSEVKEINGIKVLAKSYKNKEVEELKEIVDRIKEKLQSVVILLGTNNGKALFVAGVTKDLISKVKAGDLVKQAAIVTDGNGGGRPDFAQSGGKDGSKVNEALEKTVAYMTEVL